MSKTIPNSTLTKKISEPVLYPRVKITKQRSRLINQTKIFERYLYKQKLNEGGVKFFAGRVVAIMGQGKTELLKTISKRIIAFYGEDNVNCIMSKEIAPLIDGMDDKYVQVLIIDDNASVDEKTTKKQFAKYTLIRHILRETRKTGYIITIWAVQGLFLLAKDYRSMFNFTIIKGPSDNNFDRNTIISIVGQDIYKFLERISREAQRKENYSALNYSGIKIIGEEEPGYLYYEWDEQESEIIPWKEIIPPEDDIIAYDSSRYSISSSAGDQFGSFLSILSSEMIKEYDSLPKECGFTSKENMIDCLKIWFDKYFLGKSDLELEEQSHIGRRSIKSYNTRVNTYFRSAASKQLQKRVSERWVCDSLSQIHPLSSSSSSAVASPVANCACHSPTNQSFDCCLHDPHQGRSLLAINVKWFIDALDTTELDATPECLGKAPAALLFLGSFTNQKRQPAHVRFAILPPGEQKKMIKQLPVVQPGEEQEETEEKVGGGDSGFIREIARQIMEHLGHQKK